MLKRLDLVGFKSFAEKTTFEFGPGITAIVGPNGSGKSNIVDAVRWILGEQSARSLRGGEMADVIFNGSTSRRSLNLAEVTLTLDNSRGLLATEAAEVQITRRVHRTGEGEYLINQQPCRLKDIKDLFLGSGAGADAYCIIAQGKVDVLLQASTKERRTIFEEAAGISRFRARKTETLRKLERVEQNLQRLRDIIDEVEKQLRSVRLQAAKAQRFQEYSARLKELRLGLGLQDYHQLTLQLEERSAELERLRAELEQQEARTAAWETTTQVREAQLATLDAQLRQQEAALAECRQHIKAGETTLQHEIALAADLEVELQRTQIRLAELTGRLNRLEQAAEQSGAEFHTAATEAGAQRQRMQQLEQELRRQAEELEQLRRQQEADQESHLDFMRKAAHLHNDEVGFKAQIDNLERERARLQHKSDQAAGILATLDVELQQLEEADAELQKRLAQRRQELASERQRSEELHQQREETLEIVSALRQQRSGLLSRIEVLEGLERSHEGLGTGVREVLDLLARAKAGDEEAEPWRQCIIGMVADFLTVQREYASLIDLALGDWSQRFLVRDWEQLANLLASRPPLGGRVSFLPLDWTIPRSSAGQRRNRLIEVSLLGQVRMPLSAEGTPAHPGVVARAEQLVLCDHLELIDLPAQLLGRTLIVRDLASARAIAEFTTGYRLVTLHGELLEPDGTLTVGKHHAETGILSRKSELREVRAQVAHLDQRLAEIEADLAELRDRIAANELRVQTRQSELEVLAEQAADLRARLERHRDRRRGLHEEVTVSRDELQRIEEEIATLHQRWQQTRTQAAAAEAQVQALQKRIEQTDQLIRQLDLQRQQREHEATAGKVALAQIEERLQSLRQRHQQLQTDLEQRRRECRECENSLQASRQKLHDSERTMLATSAILARCSLDKEQAERTIAELQQQQAAVRDERQRLLEQMQAVRSQWQARHEECHAQELQVADLRHRRDTMAERLREDYQVELDQLHREALAAGVWSPEPIVTKGAEAKPFPWRPPADPAAAAEEIAELRGKLTRLGSVNLDSLQELTDLETRAATLATQLEDLQAARRALEEIIGKINVDSKRLFTETFAAVRGHFQELFRKLFGGGMADIVLEDENDILECGIDIVARPPGKELRSLSLMSGGEKTLTAVALLLALFRSKPSPFCILDEVDAALDEANIGRFVAVLREFLDQSQFILITHSKRTMATADVIYGITMQESGVSRRVAVRLEDWPDDRNGHSVAANGQQMNGDAGGSNGQVVSELNRVSGRGKDGSES